MKTADTFDYKDLQGLLRFGHGRMSEACFILLNVKDRQAAGRWLLQAPVSDASRQSPLPETALQIAFSVEGLRELGLNEDLVQGFSDEFIAGMAGDESRSRRLGDKGDSAPEQWQWGGKQDTGPHILLMHYALPGALERHRASLEDAQFNAAFEPLQILPTQDLGGIEHFGFVDGISQPKIDWQQLQSTDLHDRDRYANLVALGEAVLGYANEYGLYTDRPLLDAKQDQHAARLPDAEDRPGMKDLGRNGSYLVFRQLAQDVAGFWRFVDQQSHADAEQRERLAAGMVGRQRDGAPLIEQTDEEIAGIAPDSRDNRFNYDSDPDGHRCPLGAHIRRANPRTGDFPPGVTGFLSRMVKRLGFKQRRMDEDLIASTRFHRLLRRGRPYGAPITPQEALSSNADQAERGLHFVCLVANISRQFEFVQDTWLMNSKFNGMREESDPLLGSREALNSGERTDCFKLSHPSGPARQVCGLPRFITVRGGGYFFMPGIRALNYLASLAADEEVETP